MNKQIGKISVIVVTLTIIWTITKFSNGIIAIPFWILILSLTKMKSFELTSVLLVSEFFIGIDVPVIGPFSIIQIIGVLIIIVNAKSLEKKLVSNSLITILILLCIYFSFSYYRYFKSISFAPIDWIFIYLITTFSFEGKKEEFHFIGWLTVISISFIVFINFIIHLFFGLIAVKIYSFGNPNQIGFYSLISLIYIIYLYCSFHKKNATLLKLLFYFNSFYIVFTGSRLNSVILLIFFISLVVKRIEGFWLYRQNIFITIFLLILVIIAGGGTKKFFFRNNEDEKLKSYSISNIEDLNDSYLASFTNARSRIYYDAINLIKEKPIFGLGFLSWNDKNNDYNTLVTGKTGSRISMHSTLLQYFAETGAIGLILYLTYLTRIWKNGRTMIKYPYSIEYYYLGQLVFYIPLFMLLGSTFDNHSLNYAQIHFIGAISIILMSKK
jgi:O-antigen ligase